MMEEVLESAKWTVLGFVVIMIAIAGESAVKKLIRGVRLFGWRALCAPVGLMRKVEELDELEYLRKQNLKWEEEERWQREVEEWDEWFNSLSIEDRKEVERLNEIEDAEEWERVCKRLSERLGNKWPGPIPRERRE
jgi:hypothetical protein